MNHIENDFIHERLPNSLDKGNMQNVAKVVDELLHTVDKNIAEVLIYPAIDRLGSDLINALAIQMHCDFYDDTLPLEVRRNLVKNSIAWHRIKGTPAAVEQMIQTVYQTGIVQEWFEYGGEPYYFRVMLRESEITDERIRQLLKMIDASKNVRSWLEALYFEKNTNVSIYFGAAMEIYKRYHLRLKTDSSGEMAATIHLGGKASIYKNIRALAKYASDLETKAAVYAGGSNSTYTSAKIQQEFTEGGNFTVSLKVGGHEVVYKAVSLTSRLLDDTAVKADLSQASNGTIYKTVHLSAKV